MRDKRLILLIFAISFLYALPAYNKFWFPFDEGVTLVSADMVSRGAVPYRDFVTLYGPVQFYALALLFKIFGSYLQLAHLYIIFLHAILSTVVFYLAYKLSGSRKISVFVWIVGLSCFAPRLGASATPMWPFMTAGVLSMLFFVWFLEKRSTRDIILAALFAAVGFLGRFEMGAYLVLCEAGIMLVFALFRYIIPYLAAFSVFPAIMLVYLSRENALASLWECLKLPYTTTIKFSHNTNFPLPCLDPRQIFYGSLAFISINQHYIPVLAYIVTTACVVYLGIKKKVDAAGAATLLFITAVGVITFPYAFFGADVTHTMPVIFPALILSAFVFKEGMDKGQRPRGYKNFTRISAWLLAFLLVLLFIKNTDKYFKNVIVKPFKKDIVFMETKRGGAYVPKNEVKPFMEALEYIEKNTATDEKIFIGFDRHSDVFQGGEPMLYFISGRLPATRHFVMLVGTVNQEEVQREITASLKDVRVLLLTGEGKIVLESCKDQAGSDALDNYIRNHYKFDTRAGKYSAYIRRQGG